jgi:hypothetical protein
MADRVDAAMDPMQTPARRAIGDLMPREAEPPELSARYDAVLLRRKGRDRRIRCARSRFVRDRRIKRDLGGHSATVDPRPVTQWWFL